MNYCYNPASGMGEAHTDYGVDLRSGLYNPAFWEYLVTKERRSRWEEQDRLQREADRKKKQAEREERQRRRRAEEEARKAEQEARKKRRR